MVREGLVRGAEITCREHFSGRHCERMAWVTATCSTNIESPCDGESGTTRAREEIRAGAEKRAIENPEFSNFRVFGPLPDAIASFSVGPARSSAPKSKALAM